MNINTEKSIIKTKQKLLIGVFLIIVSSVLFLLNLIVFKAISSILSLNSSGTLVLGYALGALSSSFILSSIISFNFNNLFSRIYYTLSAIWLGTLVYLFFASSLYALTIFIIEILHINISKEYSGIIYIILSIIVSIYGVIHARSTKIKNVKIKLPNLPTIWKNKKAVWVSDLHLGAVNSQNFLSKVVNIINEINPDIIFIGGDLYDGVKVSEMEIIKPLIDLRTVWGTYFVTGNHEEFRSNKIYLESIKNSGINVLLNARIEIYGVQIIGVDDHDSTNAIKFNEIMTNLNINTQMPSILLKHQPSLLEIAQKAGISFQISGHTHKAQIFPLNFIAKIIFKGYDYGLKKFENMLIYTSSGVGTWGPPMRVGSDSEIIVFEFE